MRIHRHVGVVEAADEETLKEALALAALQNEVLHWLSPTSIVLERDAARRLADALRTQDLHPRVIEGSRDPA
jgi:hypothetical protein